MMSVSGSLCEEEEAWNCKDVPLAQELLAPASWLVKWEGVRVGNWSGAAVGAMAGRKRLGPRGGEGTPRQEKGKAAAHPLLEFRLLLQGHGVRLGNDRDDVHHFAEVFHELKIKRS